jgi:hypothetical protein
MLAIVSRQDGDSHLNISMCLKVAKH